MPVAIGNTNAQGLAMPSIARRTGDMPTGVPPGLYRVKITKIGLDIPAEYNTKTTVDVEVAIDNPILQTGMDIDIIPPVPPLGDEPSRR